MTAKISDSAIRNTLSTVEEDFLESVQAGLDGLNTFAYRWNDLHHEVENAVALDGLSPATFTLVQTVSSTISTLAEAFLSLHIQEDDLHRNLIDQTQRILDEASPHPPSHSHLRLPKSLTSHDALPSPQGPSSHSFENMTTPTPLPAYIAPAYRWLLKNIHNPYPTDEIKEAIATKTGSSRETVGDWFIRARKKMGWNALCRKHHAKSRKETLDAAYRFFVVPDPKRPLDGDLEYDFAAVLNAAKAMYSEKLLKSALAIQLDVIVKDMTPLDRARRKGENKLEKQMRKQQKGEKVRAISSYPSPDRSPGRSPDPFSPSATTDESDCDTSPPEAIAGRKRRSSSSDASHWTYNDPADRPPIKRHRYVPVAIFAYLRAEFGLSDLIMLYLTVTFLLLASPLRHLLPVNHLIPVITRYLFLPNPCLSPPLPWRQSRHL
jgi:hypothetical protein